MPCWEVNDVTLEFKVENRDLLISALNSLGLQHSISNNMISVAFGAITIDLENGKVTVPENRTSTINSIRKTYANKAIELAARRKRFLLKKVGNKMIVRKV